MRYGDGTVRGHQLANPRNRFVQAALGRTCLACNAKPGEWCVGVAENSPTKGRRRTRIHFARCKFVPGDDAKAGTR